MTDVLDDRWVQLLIEDASPGPVATVNEHAARVRVARRFQVDRVGDLLTIETHRHGRYAVVVVAGELDAATAPGFERAVQAALDTDDSVVLDLARVPFCDSRGVRAITNLLADAHRIRVELVIGRVHPQVQLVFGLLGLSELVA
jgi:anti-sigma B factor antagonist